MQIALVIAAMLLPETAWAQFITPAAPAESGPNLPAQPIGPNDLLGISVYGAPELSRTARVSETGQIRLPMLHDKITVLGMMPAELETQLAAAFVNAKILVDPAVTVSIAEYHSHPISVVGAVRAPLTFQAVGPTSLVEAITRAQGLAEDAGTEILITRPAKDGIGPARPGAQAPSEVIQRIPIRGLIDGTDPNLNVTLEGGEEVRVPTIGKIFVVGNVTHSGGFRLDDASGMSVLKALALSDGLAPFAAKVAYIYRRTNGIPAEIPVEVRKIMDRKSSDVQLLANDIFYRAAITPKGSRPELYFHFDSWRLDVGGGLWVPAQIYVEEEAADSSPGVATRFKAQSRIWDYAAMPGAKLAELTSILVESASAVKDDDASKDVSPLESQRSWERQAEENLIARLEKGGLVAPAGPVDEVLNAVVNNLIVSAKLGVDVHCRVLLTTPMESFAIGRTIVISRGLIDVLPDEASLALVLADQLAHIALGHRTPTQYAFTNQTMVSDPELLQRLRFQRTPDEMLAAGKMTIEIMRASPYSNTANAGLFLKALAARTNDLPDLLHPNLGDQIADAPSLVRMRQFTDAAPALEENKIEQIAALPLGSRVKLNPWDNRLELVKTRPLSLLSPREKMPFEVTPFILYLTRADAAAAAP